MSPVKRTRYHGILINLLASILTGIALFFFKEMEAYQERIGKVLRTHTESETAPDEKGVSSLEISSAQGGPV